MSDGGIEVRVGRSEDQDGVSALCHPTNYVPVSRCLVAIRGGRVVAYALCADESPFVGGLDCVEQLYVAPEARSAGVGSALLAGLEERSRARSRDLSVPADDGDSALRGLLEERGYVDQGFAGQPGEGSTDRLYVKSFRNA